MSSRQSVPLAEMVAAITDQYSGQAPTVQISGIAHDSRQVRPGDLFVALVGRTVDGHRFILEAIDRGAAAVVGTRPIGGLNVPYLRVRDGRLALAHLAAAFFGFPARAMTVVGVTGTDGKTTTSNFIYRMLDAAGRRVGMITTVNALIGGEAVDTGFHVTTPEAPDVQAYLAQMVAAGLSHVVIEATSHGLAQERLAACEFDVGVVTNITHEHLDYHGSYEAYRDAKARLIQGLGSGAMKPANPPHGAVLNADDPSCSYLISQSSVPVVSYGLGPGADVQGWELTVTPSGQQFVAAGPDFQVPIEIHLPGKFNVLNCLGALAAAVGVLGVEPEAARLGAAALSGIPGRMENIDLGQDFMAIVDFAHTPFALERALEAARTLTAGQVIAVFGSAGLRDRAKRGMMAETAIRLADISVLTAEDPRTESLDEILEEMAAGARRTGGVEGESFYRVPDRGEAIRFAVSLAKPGDVVMACGKGHEQSMCFGEIEYPWDDRVAMRAALGELLGVPGPEMPYLPTA